MGLFKKSGNHEFDATGSCMHCHIDAEAHDLECLPNREGKETKAMDFLGCPIILNPKLPDDAFMLITELQIATVVKGRIVVMNRNREQGREVLKRFGVPLDGGK